MSNESPQLENGYTRIANGLLEAIALAGFSKREAAIVICVLRNTYGRQGKKTAELSGSLLAKFTGMQSNHALETTRALIGKNVLTEAAGHYAKAIGINKNYGLWKVGKKIVLSSPKTGLPVPKQDVPKQDGSSPKTGRNQSQTGTKVVPKQDTYKETIKETIKDNKESNVKFEKKEPSETAQVFTHWQTVLDHPRAKLDSNREGLIKKQLSAGYSVDDLKAAIDGCKNSPFHMGKNPEQKIHDGLGLIFRNSEKVEGFMALKNKPSIPASKHSGFSNNDYRSDLPQNINPLFTGESA